MYYLDFLAQVHQRLRPETYLEVGIRNGGSLALSRCRSVGIDPAYSITAELDGDIALFRTTSDEYFARPAPLDATGGRPFDLCFIDGMHLFEYALRDFIHAERHARARGLIVFDDVLPRRVAEAARVRHTKGWTGDVYPMLAVFAKYRPDLAVITVDTQPTGLLIIAGLDPANTVLADNYAQILLEFRHADPQPVPQQLMDRLTVPEPEKVLQSELFELLAGTGADAGAADLRGRLTEVVARDFGPGFAPSAAAAASGLGVS
jgi:hypothetical protein